MRIDHGFPQHGGWRAVAGWPRRLHGDEQGTISIVSVFAVLLLTMLLGMVINVGRHADSKIRMQNAADAAAYGGGIVVARGMNGLAFSNHLLFDVFAMTAFMREARDQHSDPYIPEILKAWDEEAEKFRNSDIDKFERLGRAIPQKTPREQELVGRFSEWAAAASELVLPVLEPILAERMIPEFQRALVEATPDIAQTAANEMAERHGGQSRGRGPMLGVLWLTSGLPVGGESNALERTLPVVDPVMDLLPDQGQRMALARKQRRIQSARYLNDWNWRAMYVFDREAKMGQFGRLWRHFTCSQLNHLLEVEYPTTNLPHVIRTEWNPTANLDGTAHLDEQFTLVAVVYWQKMPELMPALFRDPIDGDSMAYAQVRFFVPKRFWVWHWYEPHPHQYAGNIGGHRIDWPPPEDGTEPEEPQNQGQGEWRIAMGPGYSEDWSLLNQHWTVQLVPATTPMLATILQTQPPQDGGANITVPDMGGLDTETITTISPH
jgi:hypothetical protein